MPAVCLVNGLCQGLDLPAVEKLDLLACDSIESRAKRLVELLEFHRLEKTSGAGRVSELAHRSERASESAAAGRRARRDTTFNPLTMRRPERRAGPFGGKADFRPDACVQRSKTGAFRRRKR